MTVEVERIRVTLADGGEYDLRVDDQDHKARFDMRLQKELTAGKPTGDGYKTFIAGGTRVELEFSGKLAPASKYHKRARRGR